MKEIIDVLKANRNGENCGIYAICSAHPLVIEASIEQALADDSPILIEATANQVNQFGGYTGMLPADFLEFIGKIADSKGYPRERIIPGGDHLGPVCWVDEPAESAMAKAQALIKTYVAAGFKKIHLDTSMGCADDPQCLPDEVVAERAALLCAVAEKTAIDTFGKSDLVYVVGTEVPPPGGAAEEIEELELTPVSRVKQTLALHQNAFAKLGLEDAWQRVIALVVQPGVEFDHTSIIDYESEKAQALKACVTTLPNIVYEAHSSDYQNDEAYVALIKDHFGILKVGPQLTLAMREAIFALSYIEDELIPVEQRSCLREVCEQEMLEVPKNWQRFYPVPASKGTLYRRYSYSDRIRYYWCQPRIQKAVDCLFDNLTNSGIPLPLISQFLPEQYRAIRNNDLTVTPEELVKAKVKQVTESYAKACWKQ
ncbi:D-tagatose-bisphosphate aldolase, class II, non-catalytic subunit [Colwellia psychrerythraea]|uniref:D-tagatose-bisphosphate aldolase, class II, non-catalytic subunit n=1 Tax=Colwellia psychrerythraea TaxID=28229 RepID=A0A099KDJ2_COLPS|nr:D-tagatose-bisphosphate aldolase, class II, non-catalytic subunit [Colwellia psychrerythraea]KGJ88400.1 D-tagatose-bisphosphate aldolase, class II, non-catalytic subunit [Colwellia psychrerythraea]